jgi:hypothetical protein
MREAPHTNRKGRRPAIARGLSFACRFEPLSDPDHIRRMTEKFSANGWPSRRMAPRSTVRNAPTAGPPPYRIYRVKATRVFGLPGTYGMGQFKPEELPKPTRWDLA